MKYKQGCRLSELHVFPSTRALIHVCRQYIMWDAECIRTKYTCSRRGPALPRPGPSGPPKFFFFFRSRTRHMTGQVGSDAQTDEPAYVALFGLLIYFLLGHWPHGYLYTVYEYKYICNVLALLSRCDRIGYRRSEIGSYIHMILGQQRRFLFLLWGEQVRGRERGTAADGRKGGSMGEAGGSRGKQGGGSKGGI